MTQAKLFWLSHRRIADANSAMLDLLYGPNPITDSELSKLIASRPERYQRFAGYIGKRNESELSRWADDGGRA